jgi:hypothetical protein
LPTFGGHLDFTFVILPCRRATQKDIVP